VLKTLKSRINKGFQVSFSTFCFWAKSGEIGVFWAKCFTNVFPSENGGKQKK
jgi:hypothetical protein